MPAEAAERQRQGSPPRQVRRARAAVATVFFLTGTVFATWASRVPAVQERLGMSAGALALALVGLSIGAVSALPVVGGLVARYGSRPVLLVGMVLYAGALPLLAVAPNLPLLALALAAFACGNTAVDVAMNTQGVLVERAYRRPILGSFHAMFSLGGIAGAAAGSVAAGQGVGAGPHFLVTGLVAVAAFAGAMTILLPDPPDAADPGPALALPKGGLWIPGLIAFCALMGEGVLNDWGAVYLHDATGADDGTAAAGFAVFSAGMVAGRLAADRIRARAGTVPFMLACGLVAGLGAAVAVAVAAPASGLVGYALLGLGLAAVVPVVFSHVAELHPDRPGPSIAAVSAVGYGGFLAGPPIIGAVAEGAGLRVAMLVPVLLMIAMTLLAQRLDNPRSTR
ncbi:MFS transporter [Streptomyces sp. NPDC126514]|uniref:MFS transporter n=1 Tax=Streptomyces sp. NPDC126514 TaxID=3155210 RepID=UPI00331FF5ED